MSQLSATGDAVASLGKPVRILLRTLRVHFQNEERVVFPLVQQCLSPTVLRAVAQRMQAIDEEARAAAARASL